MFDPLLIHSHMLQNKQVGMLDKLQRLNKTNVWFNFIIPLITVLTVMWFIKMKRDEKRKLYREYVLSD
jgi:heme/copper-type cytochrome/quinol oxidase subunit 4